MNEYDPTFDPNILIGHCDLFSWFSDFALTFEPKVVLGHCDLISRFSDFALYLDTQLAYFRSSFRL